MVATVGQNMKAFTKLIGKIDTIWKIFLRQFLTLRGFYRGVKEWGAFNLFIAEFFAT